MSAEDRARLTRLCEFLKRTQPEGSGLHRLATDVLANFQETDQ